MVNISSLLGAKQALSGVGPVVGLGVTAFPRCGIRSLISDYRIICIKESEDLDAIRREVKVLSLEKDIGGKVEKLNTLSLLRCEKVREYLQSLDERISVFVYKSSKNIERVVDDLGLHLLSNRSRIRDRFEDKWQFRKVSFEAGVDLTPATQLLIDDLTLEVFEKLKAEYGKDLVFQITDYSKGGGIGTFFVSDKKEFDAFQGFVRRRRKAGRDLKRVNVGKRLVGESASVNACVTRHGILTSSVQQQLVDLDELVGYKGRRGVFAGHQWGALYPASCDKKARSIAVKLGEYMYEQGYRGIFGIDLVVDRGSGEVGMVECNSRYTGAFPIYSMLQEERGEIPIDAWHLLEHAGIDYKMDFEKVQASYGAKKVGAQLILHNLERAWVKVQAAVKAGVYRINNSSVEWARPGFSFGDIMHKDEFVLTDGVPRRNWKLKPGARIGRLLFGGQVCEQRGEALLPFARQAVKALYKSYKLEKFKKKK